MRLCMETQVACRHGWGGAGHMQAEDGLWKQQGLIFMSLSYSLACLCAGVDVLEHQSIPSSEDYSALIEITYLGPYLAADDGR